MKCPATITSRPISTPICRRPGSSRPRSLPLPLGPGSHRRAHRKPDDAGRRVADDPPTRKEAGLSAEICCHTFRATGITAYLDNGGTLENAQLMAAHESPRTTKPMTARATKSRSMRSSGSQFEIVLAQYRVHQVAEIGGMLIRRDGNENDRSEGCRFGRSAGRD